jgi:hypothetical protein
MSGPEPHLEDDADELFTCLYCNRECCDCDEDPDPNNDYDERETNP